jgi:hypothetical protein
MNANELIEAYVADVMRRLPRKLRNDVGFELRALLGEELQARARAEGHPPDSDMALALLRGFGRPEEVADRYRPAGFDIIPPRRSAAFLVWSAAGVALQWAITLPATLAAPGAVDPMSRIGGWWTSAGLGAFWWPGFLVTMVALATWIGRRIPARAWTPRLVDRDRINRPLSVAALTFWLCGAAVLIALPWIVSQLDATPWRIAAQAFIYDADFMHWRGPWVLPLWAAGFGLYGVLIAQGRWRPLTRRVSTVLNILFCVLLVWFIAAGPIWRSATTDGVAKLCIALIVAGSLADVGVKAWRSRDRLRTPIGAA